MSAAACGGLATVSVYHGSTTGFCLWWFGHWLMVVWLRADGGVWPVDDGGLDVWQFQNATHNVEWVNGAMCILGPPGEEVMIDS